MNMFIIFFSFFLFIGCNGLEIISEKPQNTNIEKSFKPYEVKENKILFYSEDQKIIKQIDLIKRSEEELDDYGKVFSSKIMPSSYDKILNNNNLIQKVENSFNKNNLIKNSNIFLYGYLDNSILYEYDNLMRVVSEKYIDSKGELYIKKDYTYNNNYQIFEKKIFDSKGAFLEKEVFSYSEGRVIYITILSGDGKILGMKNFRYDQAGNLIEDQFKRGKLDIRLTYKKDLSGRTETISEYSEGRYRGYYKLIYDSKDRITEKRFYSPSKTLISKEVYKY
jgi:hypothetical protein